MLRPLTHRLFAGAALLAATFAISCGPDVTGPSHGSVRYARGLSFQPVFPSLASQAADAGLVPFTTVHIVLRHADGTIALDTVVNFPPDATELTLSFDVALAASAPLSGEPLTLNLAYINAAGETVFEGGPILVLAAPSVAGAPPPPPVSIPVQYTGPGSTATSVVITPNTLSVFAGESFGFTAQAFDASGAPMPGTPIVFSSSNPVLAPLASASSGSGSGTAAVGRGAVTITAQLLTGPSDAATLTVQPRPSAIAVVSGSGQSAQVNSTLVLPGVVRVTATDGLGVSGVTVTFTPSGDGVATPPSAVTDADGLAQTTWTLSSAAGTQLLAASGAGIAGPPATLDANATPRPAATLVVTGQPGNALVGASLGNITVAIEDASNNIVTTFTGSVSIALGANPGGATLAGTTTVNAVAGVATFSTLSLDRVANGYTLVAVSGALTPATSAPFNITSGPATHVEFTTQPASTVAGVVLAPVAVTVKDVSGSVATTFTGPVQISLSSNPGGGTLSGTTTVNAVAGVATFSTLSLNKSGNDYTLLAGGTGLGSEVSAPFNISATAPVTCAVTSGNNQTAPAGATLSIGISVQDAFGNGVPAAGVTAVVQTGGGTITPASNTADGSGLATFAWTLGPTVGAQSLSATCAGVATSVSVSATATPGTAGPASQLAFTVQPANSTAGVPNAAAITVTAQDAFGLTATTFTGNVSLTLAANPGGSALGGTLTVAAVAGIATFNNIRLNKIGAGYLLNAASGVLTPAVSGAFNITAAPAIAILSDSGDLQAGTINTLLPAKLVARVIDSLGNPVAGTMVTWAVATGGGSLAPNGTVAADATGRVRTQWTLGLTVGAQTVTATSAGLSGSPLGFSATAASAGFMRTWLGAVDTSWTNAANWSPAQVPGPLDSVTINSGGFEPVISTPVTVSYVFVDGCVDVTVTSTLTVTGDFLDNGCAALRAAGRAPRSPNLAHSVGGAGTIILSGTGNLQGDISTAVQITGGTHTITGGTYFGGGVTVSGGVLNLNGLAIIATSLATTGSGTLQMQSASGALDVTGDAIFAGGVETGLLTDGVLTVQGNFSASGAKFHGTGTHSLVFGGCSVAQTLDFTSPVAGKGINRLTFSCSASKTVTGAPTVLGDLTIDASSGMIDGSGTLSIGGDFIDNSSCGSYSVANTVMTGSPTMRADYMTTNLAFTGGTARLPVPPPVIRAGVQTGSITLAHSSQGQFGVTVNGNVTVSGTSAILDLNGNSLYVYMDFGTQSGGRLSMTIPTGYFQIYGSATFAGGSTAGMLTAGVLSVYTDFTQAGGSASAFSADPGFETDIGVFGCEICGLRAPLRSAKTRAAQMKSPKAIAAQQAAASRARSRAALHAARLAQIDRRAQLLAAQGLPRTPDSLLKQYRRGGLRTGAVFGTSNVTLANSALGSGSHFGDLYINGSTLILNTDVAVEGELESGGSSHLIQSASRMITSRGSSVDNITFDNTRWTLLDGATFDGAAYTTFINMDPTVDQFTVSRDGNSALFLYSWDFETVPTSGHYIKATDSDNADPRLFVDMQYPYPPTHGGHLLLVNGATSNWAATFEWTGLGESSYWNEGANWTTGVEPWTTDDIIIRAGTPHDPTLSYYAYAHNITIEPGATINLGCNYWTLGVYGNLVAPTATNSIPPCEGEGITLIGDGGVNTVTGYFGVAYIDGNYNVAGQLIVSDQLTVSGNLTVNGGRVDVGGVGGLGYGSFYTSGSGTLTMNNAADQMFVGSGGSYFQGGSTSGLLTAGTLTLVNGGVHSNSDGFAPSGSHTTVFSGNSNVEFFDPVSSFLQNAVIPDGSQLDIFTDVTVKGTLTHSGAGGGVLNAYSELTLTTSGLSNTTALTVHNVKIVFIAGTANATFSSVTWSFDNPSFAGNAFDVNRAALVTFTGHDFSGVTLGAGGYYLVNRGAGDVRMASPTPGTVTPGVQVLQIGAGLIVWPFP